MTPGLHTFKEGIFLWVLEKTVKQLKKEMGAQFQAERKNSEQIRSVQKKPAHRSGLDSKSEERYVILKKSRKFTCGDRKGPFVLPNRRGAHQKKVQRPHNGQGPPTVALTGGGRARWAGCLFPGIA